MHNHYSHIICKEVSSHFPVSLASHCSVVHQKITPKGPIQDNRCPMPHKCILPYMKIAFTLHTISSEEKLLFFPETEFDQSWYVCHPLLALSKFTLYCVLSQVQQTSYEPAWSWSPSNNNNNNWHNMIHMFLNTSTKLTITAWFYEIPYVPLLLMTCRNIIC